MLNKVFVEFLYEAAHIQRWNDHIRPNGFTELDKQAHKMMILYVLAKYEEHDHQAKLNWRVLIEGGIFEFLHRIVLTDIKPPVFHELMRVHGKKLNSWVYEELRQRILDSFQRLPNGANAAWYELTACRHEGVATAKAVGKARGAGTVDVYVSAPDGIPSEKLLTELQTVFQKSREIAVNVQVKAPTAATVNVAVTVKTAEGTDFAKVKTAVEADLAEQFNGKLLGRGVKLAELNSRIYALPGVENCHITAPSADLAANDTVLPVLGTVTVTEEA